MNFTTEGSIVRWPAQNVNFKRKNGCSTECSVESEKTILFLGKGVHHENSQVFNNLFSVMLFV